MCRTLHLSGRKQPPIRFRLPCSWRACVLMFSWRLIQLHKILVFTGNRAHVVARTPGRQVHADLAVCLHLWLFNYLSVELGSCRVEPHMKPHTAVGMAWIHSTVVSTSFATFCSFSKGRAQAWIPSSSRRPVTLSGWELIDSLDCHTSHKSSKMSRKEVKDTLNAFNLVTDGVGSFVTTVGGESVTIGVCVCESRC